MAPILNQEDLKGYSAIEVDLIVIFLKSFVKFVQLFGIFLLTNGYSGL